jgi:hypothetical protein
MKKRKKGKKEKRKKGKKNMCSSTRVVDIIKIECRNSKMY